MRTAHPRVVLGLHRSRYQRSLLTDALDLGIDAIDTSFNYHVGTLAVGSEDPAHLRQLLDSLPYEVDDLVVEQYRGLLRERVHRQRA